MSSMIVSHPLKTPINKDSHQSCKMTNSKTFKCLETLLKSSPKPFKDEEHSKRNLSSHPLKSQISLKSSSKTLRNFKKL